MIQSMPAPRELLRANALLPDDQRQSMVRLRFREWLPKWVAWEFLRIHLSPAMLAGGEQEFYQPEIYQPERVGRPECPGCESSMERLGVWHWICRVPACPQYGRLFRQKPNRGVVKVLVPPEFLRAVDGREECNSVILVLDRRYRQEVLAAIYRTAGILCEQRGWGLL